MKKLKTTIGAILFVTTLLTSCGDPSFCDCNDKYGSLSSSDKKKCAKMIDRMSSSELQRKMQNCKNK